VTVRVVHVIEAIEAGVARHVSDIVRLVDAHHHVVVPPQRTGGFTDHRALAGMREAGADIHLTEMRRSPLDRRNVAAMRAVRKLVASVEPDVVHGHAAIGGAVARIAATGSGAARVYTPNGLLPNRAAIGAERALGRLTDRFIAVSASEAEFAVARRLVPRVRIEVIANGIDLRPPAPSPIDLRSRLGVDPAVPLVGSIGRLAGQKDPATFVAACGLMARSSQARFVLIGDGPLREEVEAAAEAAGLAGRFLLIPGLEEAASVIPQFDAFVLTSRYEAGPYAPLEAMRAGTPVVVTDVAGNRDAVRAGETGLLVAPGSAEAVASAVLRLLGETALGARLTAAAREDLAARFDVTRMAERTGRMYDGVARRQP